MWIGIDDTDSLKGGCTSYVATELIDNMNYDLIGFPRLVRLNPNIPWKTRGNGALALYVGIGEGKKTEIGEIDGNKIISYSKLKSHGNVNHLTDVIENILENNVQKDAEPAYVISKHKLPYHIYDRAVKELLHKKEIIKELPTTVSYKGYNGGRGVIGAAAAIAWKPIDRTYELITYGNEKWIDKESVIQIDKEYKTTFNNYDYHSDYIALIPKANSPVFYGIRGDSVKDLKKARKKLVSAKEQRFIIFETNQATDEHLQKKQIISIKPYESVITEGIVKNEPAVIKGGHVIFSLYDKQEIDCVAYEPTKEFRDIIKVLMSGDKLVVYGGIRKHPFAINLEKINITKLADVYKKIENPHCAKCNKNMKSIGKDKGYRCNLCGKRVQEEEAIYDNIPRQLELGWYEVPVIARRHLSKPIKRMKKR